MNNEMIRDWGWHTDWGWRRDSVRDLLIFEKKKVDEWGIKCKQKVTNIEFSSTFLFFFLFVLCVSFYMMKSIVGQQLP